ncbi:MAG: hypothetical protein GY868_09975, partial [Deltaproteobacteria bacterium]|nr:hypothetical protein [Deltaproteobacteria bacterium]
MCILAVPQDAFPGLSVDRRTDPAARVLGNLKNAPRIMLFVNEKTAGLRSANFEQALAEVLRQYKIRVVDPGQVSALYDQGNAGTLKAYSGDIQAAIKTGIANRADIVIMGGVQTSSGAVYSMQSGQADIAL